MAVREAEGYWVAVEVRAAAEISAAAAAVMAATVEGAVEAEELAAMAVGVAEVAEAWTAVPKAASKAAAESVAD